MRRLAQFLAVWTDGKELMLHCRTLADAEQLARQLEAPAGVWLRSVHSVSS